MSTNYYLDERPPCECCGRPFIEERLHIGSSSGGWCFGLHVLPEVGINELQDWRDRWSKPGAVIRDEYGDLISVVEMERIITNRGTGALRSKLTDLELERNQACLGPNGLVRQRIGHHCVGHGVGTWDLILGEFS